MKINLFSAVFTTVSIFNSFGMDLKAVAENSELSISAQSAVGVGILVQQFPPVLLKVIFGYLEDFSGCYSAQLSDDDTSANCLVTLPENRLVIGADRCTIKIVNLTTRVATLIDVTDRMDSDYRNDNVVKMLVLDSGDIIFGNSRTKPIRKWNPVDLKGNNIIIGGQENSHEFYGISGLAKLSNQTVVSSFRCRDSCWIRQWDPNTGMVQSLRFFIGHVDQVNCLQSLSNGRFLSGSNDWTIKLWDSSSKQETEQSKHAVELRTFIGHADAVCSLAVLSEDRFISGSSDNTIKLWDLNTGQNIRTFREHTNCVSSLLVLNDGRFCSASHNNEPWINKPDDKTIKLWDPEQDQAVMSLNTDNPVRALAQMPNNDLVSADISGIKIWPQNGPSAVELATLSALAHQNKKLKQQGISQTAFLGSNKTKKNTMFDCCVIS